MKKGYSVVCTILVYVLVMVFISQVGLAGCAEKGNLCYTTTSAVASATGRDKYIKDEVCRFDPSKDDKYECIEKDYDNPELTHCCTRNPNKNGMKTHGYATTKEGAEFFRKEYAENFHNGIIAPMYCYPGRVRKSDGSCKPSIPDPVGRITKTWSPVFGQTKFCNEDEAVCKMDHSSFITVPYVTNKMSCCKLKDGIKVDLDDVEVIKKDEDLGNVGEQKIMSCGPNRVVCGITAKQIRPAGTDHYISEFKCCKLKPGTSVEPTSFEITSRTGRPMQNFNYENVRQCYPNEVMCSVGREVRKPPVGAAFGNFNTVGCCPIKKCAAEPDCSNPGQDADCDGKPDVADPVCIAAANADKDDDNDGIKNGEGDKCPDTPAGEVDSIVPLGTEGPLADFIGCGPSQVDADKSNKICNHFGGWWFSTGDNTGVCCGGEGKEENFVVEGKDGKKKVCIGSQPLENKGGQTLTTGGANLLTPRRRIGHLDYPLVTPGNAFQQPFEEDADAFTIESRGQTMTLKRGKTARTRKMKRLAGDQKLMVRIGIALKGNENVEIRYKGTGEQTVGIGAISPTRALAPGEHIYEFQLSKLAPREDFRVLIQNKGPEEIKITGINVYMPTFKKVLYLNDQFYGCNDVELFETDPVNEVPIWGEDANQNNIKVDLIGEQSLRPESCEARSHVGPQGKQYFCNVLGEWQQRKDNPRPNNILKEVPSGQIQESIGVESFAKLFGFPVLSGDGCCEENQCWQGNRCIDSSDKPVFQSTQEKGKATVFCKAGEWMAGAKKQNQFDDGHVPCPEGKCAYTVKGDAGTVGTCYADGSIQPAVRGEEKDDIVCNNGEWYSREAMMAKTLIDLPGIGKQYSLYCGSAEDVLLSKDFTPALPEGTRFEADHVCMIEYGTHAWKDGVFNGLLSEMPLTGNVIVALGLKRNQIIKAGVPEEFVLTAFSEEYGNQEEVLADDEASPEMLFTYCLGAMEYQEARYVYLPFRRGQDRAQLKASRPEWAGCSGNWDKAKADQAQFNDMKTEPNEENNVFYSHRLQTVLYSPKPFTVE